MRKYTKRELKDAVREGFATDITGLKYSELIKLKQSRSLEKIGYVPGRYGIAAGMLKDRDTGEHFAILERNTTLLAMF